MKSIKGKIVKIIGKMIEPSIKYIETEAYFCYDIMGDFILFSFEAENDAGFLEHLEREHKEKPRYSYFFYSLLHEIGHYHTVGNFNLNFELETKILCSVIPSHTAKESIDFQNMYYNLPSEFSATEWAIEYTHEHKIFCNFINLVFKICHIS